MFYVGFVLISQRSVTEAAAHYHRVVSALHENWSPHPSQALVGRAIFSDMLKFVFVQCGRKWGKTEIIVYSLWRWALLNPNSSCYYICPELKQAKEIIWKSKDKRGRSRIQAFGPADFIDSIDNTELRVNFKNGSFIKCDGSDNWSAWKGISPNFIVLDEFSDFKPEFFPAMNPNRAVFDAPLVIIGTPPEKIWLDKDTPHQYVEKAQEARELMLEDGSALWIKRPSWDNPDPTIQMFLRKEKKSLFRANKQDEWWRDYGAELMPAKASKIFPNFISDMTLDGAHVADHSTILDTIMRYTNE